ncbi:hypothetical protein FBU59_002323 [Linderina macrospora]|uniref:Uncharacterized protein n=1 Tax=Linderina macrospora TaxID=4868 RepID=A0ACC1JBM5_9FUNG|nr:hypothetical protein FBU59_002323 [Linderina macrospora]
MDSIHFREKAQKEAAKHKQAVSQFKARENGIHFTCPICKAPNAFYKNLVLHMENKHPNAKIPSEAELAH